MNAITIIVPSLIISFFLNKFFQNYFLKNNYIDKINKRSSHNVLATRSGGTVIISTLMIISVISYLVNIELYEYSILVPIMLLYVVGLYDDINGVSFKLKFIFQIIVAKVIIDNGLILDNLHGMFGIFDLSTIPAQIITLLIIVSIINSLNFIDGLDGLATSVIFIFILCFEFFSKYDSGLINLSTIIVASSIPVFIGNFSKNKKIFLGDSGSLFLGSLASIYILTALSNNYIIKTQFDLNKIIFIISIFFYPIIDFTRIIIRRIINNKSPFVADKNHIHHLLLEKYQSHVKVVGIIFITNLIVIISLQIIF